MFLLDKHINFNKQSTDNTESKEKYYQDKFKEFETNLEENNNNFLEKEKLLKDENMINEEIYKKLIEENSELQNKFDDKLEQISDPKYIEILINNFEEVLDKNNNLNINIKNSTNKIFNYLTETNNGIIYSKKLLNSIIIEDINIEEYKLQLKTKISNILWKLKNKENKKKNRIVLKKKSTIQFKNPFKK